MCDWSEVDEASPKGLETLRRLHPTGSGWTPTQCGRAATHGVHILGLETARRVFCEEHAGRYTSLLRKGLRKMRSKETVTMLPLS